MLTNIRISDEVRLVQNAEWNKNDKDYVNTLTDLSAVWPTLRHGQYTWAVVEDNPNDDF